MSSYTHLRAFARARASLPCNIVARQLHQSAVARRPYKDDQDKDSLKPKAHEYTQSGTDDQVSQHEDAAFNPNKTRPEEEKEAAKKGSGGNPLEMSPADKDVAKGGKGAAEDATKQDKQRRSGGGSAPKAGTAA